MSLLDKAIRENCGCGGDENSNNLLTFLVRRSVADEEEVAEPVNPVGPGPGGEDGIDAQIVKFFKDNPSPSDEEVHELAAQAGMEHEEFEERVYRLLHSLLNKEE